MARENGCKKASVRKLTIGKLSNSASGNHSPHGYFLCFPKKERKPLPRLAIRDSIDGVVTLGSVSGGDSLGPTVTFHVRLEPLGTISRRRINRLSWQANRIGTRFFTPSG
jgi:hypothetical protein